jgi:hypothetical protein
VFFSLGIAGTLSLVFLGCEGLPWAHGIFNSTTGLYPLDVKSIPNSPVVTNKMFAKALPNILRGIRLPDLSNKNPSEIWIFDSNDYTGHTYTKNYCLFSQNSNSTESQIQGNSTCRAELVLVRPLIQASTSQSFNVLRIPLKRWFLELACSLVVECVFY